MLLCCKIMFWTFFNVFVLAFFVNGNPQNTNNPFWCRDKLHRCGVELFPMFQICLSTWRVQRSGCWHANYHCTLETTTRSGVGRNEAQACCRWGGSVRQSSNRLCGENNWKVKLWKLAWFQEGHTDFYDGVKIIWIIKIIFFCFYDHVHFKSQISAIVDTGSLYVSWKGWVSHECPNAIEKTKFNLITCYWY